MAERDAPLVDLSDLGTALGLLTRLPAAEGVRGPRAAWAWPLAGLIVAALAGLAGWLLLAVGLVPGVAAAAVLALLALMTGAMHEDGLADSADGLFGGWDRARRLEVMRDSRIGTYGMLGLLLVTLGRWAALSFLMATGHILGPLVAAAMLSRAALPVVMIALPAARTDGLSVRAGTPPKPAALLGLALALVVALIWIGWAAIPAAIAAGLAVAAVAAVAQARIGGQTGDILGAAQQLADLAVLAALTAVL